MPAEILNYWVAQQLIPCKGLCTVARHIYQHTLSFPRLITLLFFFFSLSQTRVENLWENFQLTPQAGSRPSSSLIQQQFPSYENLIHKCIVKKVNTLADLWHIWGWKSWETEEGKEKKHSSESHPQYFFPHANVFCESLDPSEDFQVAQQRVLHQEVNLPATSCPS